MSAGKKVKRAFTFIEVTLVTAILSIIALAIYASLSSGTKVWKKASAKSFETEASIFFDKISNDLRNWLVFSGIACHGTKNELYFSLMQEGGYVKGAQATDDSAGADNPKNTPVPDFGAVRYYFDAEKGLVYRDYTDYQAVASKKEAKPRLVPILENVLSLTFKYYYFDVSGRKGSWSEGLENAVPSAVSIEVTFAEAGRTKKMTKTIALYVKGSHV